MNKRFRAWDGTEYWYSDENLLFISGSKAFDIMHAPFDLKDVDMYIGKNDSKGMMIYENDLIMNRIYEKDLADNPNLPASKIYQVIWSDDECGFRKVPHNMPFPETKIDSAFMEVIGTINSQE